MKRMTSCDAAIFEIVSLLMSSKERKDTPPRIPALEGASAIRATGYEEAKFPIPTIARASLKTYYQESEWSDDCAIN